LNISQFISPATSDPGISVIICTYNGAKRLPETLKHLFQQQFDQQVSWEIIVVDNNSSDATYEVAITEGKKYQSEIPFTVFQQPEPGKSYALDMGISKAQFDIIVICDDDNHLNKNYLNIAWKVMRQYKNIGVLGGQSYPVCEAQNPFWFDEFQSAFVVGPQLSETGIANGRKYLWGAGMVIRKEIFNILNQLSFQSILTCRKADTLSSGGDSETCLLSMFLGYDLYYDERLQFEHYIPAKRLSWKYCVEMITKGFAHPQIYYYLYEYCHNSIMEGNPPSFELAFNRNRKKLLRGIAKDFSGVRNFFISLKLLMSSTPGSIKEIEIKKKINKLIFLYKNKKTIEKDFHTICAFMNRLKEEKNKINVQVMLTEKENEE
jgi:glycosyltransferase involved in cell wall biosynthesis